MLPGAILILLPGAGSAAAAIPPTQAPDYAALAAAEATAIAGAGDRVHRAGGVLTLRTARGPKIFRDRPTEGEDALRSCFVSLLHHDTCALVAQFGWEGWGYRLVHLPTGRTLELDGVPCFSPDGRHAAVVSLDLDARYARNSLAILAFTDQGVRQVFFHDFGGEAGPAEPVWEDSRAVAFRWYRRVPGSPVDTATVSQGRLELRRGGWVLR
jgi:hypothetical protein